MEARGRANTSSSYNCIYLLNGLHPNKFQRSNEKIPKARKGIGVIKYLSSYVPVKTLDQIYKMYVRPNLDFCDVIYHIPEIDSLFDSSSRLSYWMNRIESLQYQAALAVTGAWQGTNTDKIYEELGWESLSKFLKFKII